MKQNNSQIIDPITHLKKKSLAISDFSNVNVPDKDTGRAASPILSINTKKTESIQTAFGRSITPGHSRTQSKSPSGVQVVAIDKMMRKGVDNQSIKRSAKQMNPNLGKYNSDEISLNSKSISNKTLKSTSNSYLDDDDLIAYAKNNKNLANDKKKNRMTSKPLSKFQHSNVDYANRNQNQEIFTPIYQIDMFSISTRNDIDDDFDLMNQTADEKVTSFEKNEPQINSHRRNYSIKLQSTQSEMISHSTKKPQLENSFFDVNGPDKSYIDDDFNKNIESPKFTSSQQAPIEFAKTNINSSVNENISNNKKSPVNNKQLDKITDSWAIANDDPNESVDLLLPVSITSKLLEKPEFLSNKRIGRPRM